MPVLRYRSSEQLSNLLSERDARKHHLCDNVAAAAIPATDETAPTTTTTAKKSNSTNGTSISYVGYRLLTLLAAMTTLLMKLSSINNEVMLPIRQMSSENFRTVASPEIDDNVQSSTTQVNATRAFHVDIISIGSIHKADFQSAQEGTFRTHPSVRNFYRINEFNDTDATCHTNLSSVQLQQIVKHCKSPSFRQQQSQTSWLIRRALFHPKNLTGWMCAQQRPIDGLHIALQQYKKGIVSIPSYLFIIDDDTYLNMNSILSILQTNHSDGTDSNSSPQLIAGCRYNYPQKEHFLFPYGGFGTIMSKTAIQNLMKPINCSSYENVQQSTSMDGFEQAACWRLQQNVMGERQFFQNGMSIGDLMYTFATEYQYTQIDSWTNGHGFCFHSDHALGYFFGYYHIAVPEEQFTVGMQNSSTTTWDTLRYNYGYVSFDGPPEGCKHIRKRCSSQSSICHYIEPKQMYNLFQDSINAQQ
jgi:Fringe-like